MFDRILAPIDGSHSAMNALEAAYEMAKIHGSTVTVIHVMTFTETVPNEKTDKPEDYIDDYISKVRNADLNLLADAVAKGEAAGLKDRVTSKLMIGVPGEAIVAESQKGEYDLIVIGDRGLTGVKEMLLGSVSKHVVDESKIPVLVVKLFF